MRLIIYILLLASMIIPDSEFKNVKVLDIQSRSEMKTYMKSIAKDLGVKCSHCHNMDDKSIDTDEKDIAREMMKLTRYLNDLLNTQFKDSANHKTYVSCWTCHYGKLEPVSKRPEE